MNYPNDLSDYLNFEQPPLAFVKPISAPSGKSAVGNITPEITDDDRELERKREVIKNYVEKHKKQPIPIGDEPLDDETPDWDEIENQTRRDAMDKMTPKRIWQPGDPIGTNAPPREFFTTRAQHRELPNPSYLIKHIIQDDKHVAFVASWGSLKSFVAIDLACSLVTGKPAFGKVPVKRQAPCFYYAPEGYSDVVKKRITAWEISRGLTPYSLNDGMENLYVCDRVPLANDDKLLTEMIAGMRYHLGERKAGMVFIDTLNHSLNGLNESDSATANAYFKVVDKIKSAVGGSTCTVHHFGKDTSRGSRGTVAFEAGWDTVFFIDQHHQNPVTGVHYIAVLVKKQKSGSANYYFYLKSRAIELPASEIPQDDEPHIEGMPKDDDKCSLVLEWSDAEEFAMPLPHGEVMTPNRRNRRKPNGQMIY
jgi:hypothetical protein